MAPIHADSRQELNFRFNRSAGSLSVFICYICGQSVVVGYCRNRLPESAIMGKRRNVDAQRQASSFCFAHELQEPRRDAAVGGAFGVGDASHTKPRPLGPNHRHDRRWARLHGFLSKQRIGQRDLFSGRGDGRSRRKRRTLRTSPGSCCPARGSRRRARLRVPRRRRGRPHSSSDGNR
jgi:hypothetical protein